jgi:cyclomaltodextrinase / maltogenic alpha-amylase / neopullulanase
MSVPAWVKDAMFYQIFPDRFENGDHGNDPSNKVKWDSMPTPYTFFGGDLQGIITRLDHLTELGINAIYLNPIFQSPSTHRYNATDYFQIDRKLGDMKDWKALVKPHTAGICASFLMAFLITAGGDFSLSMMCLENGEHSPYRDWFHILTFQWMPILLAMQGIM